MEEARFNMIEQQVRPWSVLDSTVLRTMGSIPRDVFVPETLKSLAYADIEVPMKHGEAMMHPRVEGRMLQELEIDIDDECLEIGTGSGYITACLATMSNHVDSIDIHDDFLQSASDRLSQINISNVQLTNNNAITSLNTHKKYDAVAITGSVPEYLPEFEKLLKPDGRLFIVVGFGAAMHAMKVSLVNGEFIRTNLFETKLNALVGTKSPSNFSF